MDYNLNALKISVDAKLVFNICGVRMSVVSVTERKGVTKADEKIVEAVIKSESDETKMVITGSSGFIIDLLGSVQLIK